MIVSGKSTEHRLAQHAHQIVAAVAARAIVNQVSVSDGHQAERVIEFATDQQACIGSDAGTVEFQFEAAVEIEPESIGMRFTRGLHHPRRLTRRVPGRRGLKRCPVR